jgi:tetratricopeptide (TPR) repeat protein
MTALSEKLGALYSVLAGRAPAGAAAGEAQDGEELDEQVLATRVWEELEDRPIAEQRAVVRRQICFRTTALFDLLRAKSREAGRRDRQRGVEVAELALASLEGCGEALGEDLPNRKAQGWISIANARRVALDFPAAELGFVVAESEWSLAEDRDPLVEAEFLLYKGALRWFQRSYHQAVELVGGAIGVFRKLDQPALLAQSLILRVGINQDTGNLESTFPDLREALQLINEREDIYLCCSAYTHLATSHIRLEEFEEGAEAVAKAREFCCRLEYRIVWYQILWLDGLVKQGQGQDALAERFLKQAHEGFLGLGERGYGAVIALDRAMLCHKRGRSADVLGLASQAIPILEALRFRREVLAALKLLREALAAQELTMALLQQVRDCLDGVLRDPATWPVLRES